MSAQPELAVGQVWRNRSSGRLVRIERFLPVGSYARVEWTALGGRGPRHGFPYNYTWTGRYTFVADSEADL